MARAHAVATRCGVPAVPRLGSLARALGDDEGVAYMVGRRREWLVQGDRRVHVDRGMLHAHRAAGPAHPLLRALGRVDRVIDCTLGLCHDAIHVADVAGADVVGIEISAALCCLAEASLPRMAADGLQAASRIRVVQGDARQRLAEVGPADAVMLSPMFDVPATAAPGFDLLRLVATGAPLDAPWLQAALAAAPRVVLKARRGQPVPDFATGPLSTVLRGKSVDYWVFGAPT